MNDVGASQGAHSRQYFRGQRALVTGASSGIGAALAEALAAEGAALVLTARRLERLQDLAATLRQRYQVQVDVVAADLAQPAAAKALFDATEGRGLAIDVLINNAAFGELTWFEDAPWSRYADMIQVNLVALTELAWIFVPHMRARRYGRIVNVASLLAFSPTPMLAVYAATKSYVNAFTLALGNELRGTGVEAMVVLPGITLTEFADRAGHRLTKLADRMAMQPHDCARSVVAGLKRRASLVVPGTMNALLGVLMRRVPLRWLPRVARMVGQGSFRPLPPMDNRVA